MRPLPHTGSYCCSPSPSRSSSACVSDVHSWREEEGGGQRYLFVTLSPGPHAHCYPLVALGTGTLSPIYDTLGRRTWRGQLQFSGSEERQQVYASCSHSLYHRLSTETLSPSKGRKVQLSLISPYPYVENGQYPQKHGGWPEKLAKP